MERETRIPVAESAAYDEQGDQIRIPPEGQPYVVQVGDEDGIAEALMASEQILRYIGGVVTLFPVRREVKPGSKVYVTTEIGMRWNSFIPGVDAEDAAEAGSNGQPEPVATA